MNIAILLFPNVTLLDFAGPAQVLRQLRGAMLHYVSSTMEPVPTDCGFSVLPTTTFDELTEVDILCVPGGYGSAEAMEDEATLAWVAEIGAQARWVTSVCTGSMILGAAGLLKGYRAGSHWMWRDELALFGAEPVADRVVFDRNRVTGGGVTAGIDFALALSAVIQGEDHAKRVQLTLEYDPAPPFDSGSPEKAAPETVAAIRERVATFAPDRRERIKAVAKMRGFLSQMA